MPPKHLAHLSDILVSANLIFSYIDGLTFDDYLSDLKARDAVERRFAVIGEALNRLRRDAPDVYARIDHTAEIAAFRNIIVHVYDQLDHEIVWKVIETDLKQLMAQAKMAIERSS